MSDTPTGPTTGLTVEVRFDLDEYLSTFTRGVRYDHNGEPEETHFAEPYPFGALLVDRVVAALAERILAGTYGFEVQEVRREVSAKVAERVNDRVEAEVERLLTERLTPTDQFGRALGDPTSIEARILKIAERALDQPETSNRSRSTASATGRTRFDVVVEQAVQARIEAAVDRAVETALTDDKLTEALRGASVESALRSALRTAADNV